MINTGVAPNHFGGTASVSSTELLAANSLRVGLEVSNLHASVSVYISFGVPAVVGQGIFIGAGKTWKMEGIINTQAVYIVCDSDSPDYCGIEF